MVSNDAKRGQQSEGLFSREDAVGSLNVRFLVVTLSSLIFCLPLALFLLCVLLLPQLSPLFPACFIVARAPLASFYAVRFFSISGKRFILCRSRWHALFFFSGFVVVFVLVCFAVFFCSTCLLFFAWTFSCFFRSLVLHLSRFSPILHTLISGGALGSLRLRLHFIKRNARRSCFRLQSS